MSVAKTSEVISHWHHLVSGMQQSSDQFYQEIDRLLTAQQLDGTKTERVQLHEGSVLSAKREYLQVRRKEHVFHICAAPFGDGFFVSWWLGDVRSGLWAWLTSLPLIGNLLAWFGRRAKPYTYYRIDTAIMFQSVTHGAVIEALERVVNATGSRALTELEKKPVMRELFARLSGGNA